VSSELARGLLGLSCCELFGNPEEGEHLQREAPTEQWLVKM
jgi:hypothetical protein